MISIALRKFFFSILGIFGKRYFRGIIILYSIYQLLLLVNYRGKFPNEDMTEISILKK